MHFSLRDEDRIGLFQPLLDAHTMGPAYAARLLRDCGYSVQVAGAEVRSSVDAGGPAALVHWARGEGITVLGLAYRLNPEDGARFFDAVARECEASSLLESRGGPLRGIFFAGLPETCALVRAKYPSVVAAFPGDETPAQTLSLLGVPPERIPAEVTAGTAYDEALLSFGRDLVRRGEYQTLGPVDRSGSPLFGRRGERVEDRVAYGAARGLPPLLRAHMGPYLPDRAEAVRLFYDWTQRLARSGYLDVLSIGSSQLSQSRFGEDWGDAVDGGGVPLSRPEEFAEAWRVARPMLVRTYAGTKNIVALSKMFEETIDIAWHALSFWWFCALDGRGANPVAANLEEHHAALRSIAAAGKPFEGNVPHHFGFRGADDLSYVVSAYMSARAAKAAGVRTYVLQIMLNTPKATWGLQDLAKARATVSLVRSLQGPSFRVLLQPRGGLDYFSPDLEKAKAQLAAVTALMDDIEPRVPTSPEIIHVVSYSEAVRLADPETIDESARITRCALETYRRERRLGHLPDMATDREVEFRTRTLLEGARTILGALESSIEDPYGPRGMYEALVSGFFPLPHLSHCREEFSLAAGMQTRMIDGGVVHVDDEGLPVPASERAARAAETARRRKPGRIL